MKKLGLVFVGAMLVALGLYTPAADVRQPSTDELWRHRNLGKAFYENPTTHTEAVTEFERALQLAPGSARERVNYGLALLRAGKVPEGIAQLEAAQKQDPSIPHTWFNLGIEYKRRGDIEPAIVQLEGMLKLVPHEAITHYNLGVLYKMAGRSDDALKQFELSTADNPNLAGAHFQLFTAYKAAGKPEAAHEWEVFQKLKKRQQAASTPEDLEWSFFSEIYDTVEPRREAGTPAAPEFETTRTAVKLDPKTAALAVMPGANEHPVLVAWSSAGIVLLAGGTAPVEHSGLEGITGVVSVAPADFNNDGLSDLAVITAEGAQLYINQGSTFQKAPVAVAGHFAKAVWLDYDHDGDVDLFLLGPKSVVMRNDGKAGFSNQSADFPFVAGDASDGAVFQQLPDSDQADLVVTYADHDGVVYRDQLGGHYRADTSKAIPAGKAVLVEDVNNDGWLDLVVANVSAVAVVLNQQGSLERAQDLPAGAPLAAADIANRGTIDLIAGGALYWNAGGGRFSPAQGTPLKPVALVSGSFGAAACEDLAAVETDGTVVLVKNRSALANRSVRVGLSGVRNPKLAMGAMIEVKAGASYQKRVYRGTPVVFGLGQYAEADTIRITWPNGLIQNEPKQRAGAAYAYKEAQRLSGSCPMIFVWNGRSFEFVTDVLGVAPLGASSGDGRYFPTDHREYVRIPGESLAERNGRYEVRVTEELREVSYIDQIRLIAMDHPAAIEVFTNDKFKSPPFPDFRLFGVERRIYPDAARDSAGHDVRPKLVRRDNTYPDGFRRTMTGVAEMHSLVLDFGHAASDNRAVLVLSGWVDWADGSTFRAVSQESKEGFVLPYLQVKDQNGAWKTVIEDMGIPAGKPKTIVVDLTGKFLSASREVRIVTNLCVYWDEIYLSEKSAPPEARLTELPLEQAGLEFRGFSRPVVDPLRRQPERFDYSHVLPVSNWNPTAGLYTRYGDVRPLVGRVDDRLVIMGSGDEMRLNFDARSLPPVAPGWKRDFLLYVDGWAKDADANTAFAKSVEPLPFHGMSAYPYRAAEHFPDDSAHREYRSTYNTRPALRLMRPLTEPGFAGAASK